MVDLHIPVTWRTFAARRCVLLAAGLTLGAAVAPGVAHAHTPSVHRQATTASLPPLDGDWNFESGSGTELTGKWSQFTTEGSATIDDQGLAVSSSDNPSFSDIQNPPSAWAEADGYSGPAIVDKTLVAWVKLSSTSQLAGSPLSIDEPNAADAADQGAFDAIDFAETTSESEWEAGSDSYIRTEQSDGFPDNESVSGGTATQEVAISYAGVGTGTETITGYLNGRLLGSYVVSGTEEPTFTASDSPVALFGPRSVDSDTTDAHGGIDASILESRIYGGALSAAQVSGLKLTSSSSRLILKSLSKKNGNVVLRLSCAGGTSSCKGAVAETARVKIGDGRNAKTKIEVVAVRHVTLEGGRTLKLTIAPNATGRRALKESRHLAVTVTISQGSSRVARRKVALV